MKPIFFLVSLLVSLSISIRAHSQIELFGMSWAKSNGDLLSILQINGYIDDQYKSTGKYSEMKIFKGKSEQFFCVTKDGNQSPGKASGVGRCNVLYESCNDECYTMVRITEEYGGKEYIDFDFSESEKLSVNTKQGRITFLCSLFNGCEYRDEEIAQFVLDNVGASFEADETGYVSMNYDYEKGFCGRGDKGDEVCVKDQTITLYRGSYGTGGMTLSFN